MHQSLVFLSTASWGFHLKLPRLSLTKSMRRPLAMNGMITPPKAMAIGHPLTEYGTPGIGLKARHIIKDDTIVPRAIIAIESPSKYIGFCRTSETSRTSLNGTRFRCQPPFLKASFCAET